MEQPQEQLKRGLTRAVLKHGWLPRLCTVARRLSFDDYLRPHSTNSFLVNDREIHSATDLTRRISESNLPTRQHDNQSLFTPLPWDVLKNTAIPSVADLLRRTCPIRLPVPSTSAPNFPGSGAANTTTSNGSSTVEGRQSAVIQTTASSWSDVQPNGSGVTRNSTPRTIGAVVHSENETQVAQAVTQHEETRHDVSTISTQCELNTCDVSTETRLTASNTATQCVVNVTDAEVQAVKWHETRETQCTLHAVEIGTQTEILSKSTSTETETVTYKDTSIQCGPNWTTELKDGYQIKDSKDKQADLNQLTDHIAKLVQHYSNKINHQIADVSHDILVKKRVTEFLETLQRPTPEDPTILHPPPTDFSTAKQESCACKMITNGTDISDRMSPQPVTNLRKYLRDSYTDTIDSNDEFFTSYDEVPPSDFGFPEEGNSLGGPSWVAISPEEGRSGAQSPLYRLPPPARSQRQYEQHQPAVTENQQVTPDESVIPTATEETMSLFDDGTGNKVPNVSVPIVQENDISWRLKPDGTCHILGAGSFGSVASATFRRPDGTTLDVAVKKYRFERDRRSFIREGKMNSFLSDTGVFPEFYGFLRLGSHNNPVICLVSELYGNGTTLDDVLVQNNLGSLRAWMSLAVQLAEGLRKIHDKNVIFNDLKPNNIVVNASRPGEPILKFIDLGISSYKQGITYNFTAAQLRNVPHLAPEVKLQQPTSILSDIWALGLTYWEMACVSRLPGLKEVAKAALKDKPEERISLDGITDTLVAISRCQQF